MQADTGRQRRAPGIATCAQALALEVPVLVGRSFRATSPKLAQALCV